MGVESGTEEEGALTDSGVRDAVVAHLVRQPAPTKDDGQPTRSGWTSSIRYRGWARR